MYNRHIIGAEYLKPPSQHVRNIQERETRELDEKEVYISEKQKSDKDLTLTRKWVEKGEKTEMKEITGESIAVKSITLHPFANLANNTPV
jgi:hypothetical protein